MARDSTKAVLASLSPLVLPGSRKERNYVLTKSVTRPINHPHAQARSPPTPELDLFVSLDVITVVREYSKGVV